MSNEHRIPTVDKHFLRALPPAAGGLPGFKDYEIAGERWSGHPSEHGDSVSLHRHCDFLDMLEVKVSHDAAHYQWEWCRKLNNGIYVRAYGKAESIESACAAALAYQPTIRIFHYLGETAWYELNGDFWIADLDGEEAHIYRFDDEYKWNRTWGPGEEVFALIDGGFGLGRKASALEDAMRACIDAPELFKRACAALVMKLTEQ